MGEDTESHMHERLDLRSLIGLRFPDGSYTITADENERLRAVVDAPELPRGLAHPIFGHLATHIGKGITFAELAELVGSRFDAGFLFGGGSLVFEEPLRTDTVYIVRGGITGVESRIGRRFGQFDVITTELDLVDAETGKRVSRSVEQYICPRT
jgi:hypothetical protein